MLRNCPECGGTTSDQAASCPHCGHPLMAANIAAPSQRRAPLFTILAALGLVLCLFTPRLILILPLFGTVACAVIALFRKEQAKAISIVVLVLTAGLLVLSSMGSSSSMASAGGDSSSLSSVKIDDWNWRADPEFGTSGAIIWNVSIRNLTDKYVDNVRVELTTYDKTGKLITTTFTYVDAIPPGGTRSKEGYADYFGTEGNASAQVTEVQLSH